MAGKLIENTVVPIIGAMGGSSMHTIERPGCLHMVKIAINTTATNAITHKERERILAELNTNTCEQCAKEKKNG